MGVQINAFSVMESTLFFFFHSVLVGTVDRAHRLLALSTLQGSRFLAVFPACELGAPVSLGCWEDGVRLLRAYSGVPLALPPSAEVTLGPSLCVHARAFLDLFPVYLLISLLTLTCSGLLYDEPAQAMLAGSPPTPPSPSPGPLGSPDAPVKTQYSRVALPLEEMQIL